ncbi:putative chromo domain-containing protein LHP1 isoform X3 [Aphelenchoides fujianensis]|nr:putative chromo domain-containing protein LHP1 isoform X3 [Aphelenchoides fujianensis]
MAEPADPMASISRKAGELLFVAARGAAQNVAAENSQMAPKQKEPKPKKDEEEDVEGEESEDDEESYEVDYIMKTRMQRGKRFFYIHWKGFDETFDTWEPEENLDGAQEIVKAFMATYNASKTPKRTPKAAAKKPAATSSSDSGRKRGRPPRKSLSDEPASKETSDDDDDEEYGGKKKKRQKPVEKPTASEEPRLNLPPTFTSVPALNSSMNRKMNMGLRWLDEDSNDEETSDVEPAAPTPPAAPAVAVVKPPVLSAVLPAVLPPPPSLPLAQKESPPSLTPVLPQEPVMNEENHPRSKEKRKKKKSKKHAKDRERSGSPDSERAIKVQKPQLTFLSAFHPGTADGDLRFVVKNNATGHEYTLSLGEAYMADSWHLCRFLASKIQFQPSGEQRISEPNGAT